eukprot:7952426-Alexandrium_andersonii.AAC.1
MSASLVGSEMCIRDSSWQRYTPTQPGLPQRPTPAKAHTHDADVDRWTTCLLYTSDAADDM